MMPWSWPWGVIPIREKELKELEEKAEKLEAVKTLLSDVCDYYGTDFCQEGVCDLDRPSRIRSKGPMGWEGCLTQKILKILEAEI